MALETHLADMQTFDLGDAMEYFANLGGSEVELIDYIFPANMVEALAALGIDSVLEKVQDAYRHASIALERQCLGPTSSA